MKFIYPASEEQLSKIQWILDKNPEPGIVDIRASFNSSSIVAEETGSILGVATIIWGDDASELYKLYVVPNHKRKGVGTALANKTIDILKEHNVKELLIEIAGESRPFWENFILNHRTINFDYDKFSIAIT